MLCHTIVAEATTVCRAIAVEGGREEKPREGVEEWGAAAWE
jgi:hypothetical protein